MGESPSSTLLIDEEDRVKKILPLAIMAMAFVVAGSMGASAESAMERLEERNILSVCADPYIYPYSSASSHPPGFDIEIIQKVAERKSWP